MSGEFADAALILVGHGSTLNAESALPTLQQADELRRRGHFAQVLECFWKEQPSVCGVLRGVFVPRVFIVPLFISDGYFTEEVIPRELGLAERGQLEFPRIQNRGGRLIHYCGPVGTHPSMTEIVLARARDILERFPASGPVPSPSQVSLFVAGHGTGNNENSRRAIENQVLLIRKMNLYHDVHAVFMEEDPYIRECYGLAETPNIVMVPFFISDGLHSYEDIPVMLGAPEEAVKERYRSGEPTWVNPTTVRGKRVWYTASIGREPHLPDVIMERVREAVA
ncbi:MAG TPA: CbiX/SirB N-terminal domain-containing protein [Candidatus Limnocylindria bacterium]|jgi:sirohydrochlorin cobaltochelatase|nr:CbiX/SirB N-terminal domain-containing protein [Candidatus Limnocylindria bacterium]